MENQREGHSMQRRRDHGPMARVRGKMAVLGLAAALVVPGVVLFASPTTAGAAQADPLGPTITQLENFYAVALANTEGTLANIEGIITGELPSQSALAALEGYLGCAAQNWTYILPFFGGGPPPCAGDYP
jgi:hypothetical protein